MGQQAQGLGGFLLGEPDWSRGSQRQSQAISSSDHTKRTHKKHLRSEKMSEILQAMEVTFSAIPMAAEATLYSVVR